MKTSQKIRYFRHKNFMYAKDVAKYLGITRKNYCHYEGNTYDYCPLSTLEKLSQLYQIPITELLDDYHLFLYNNPGKFIRQYRKSLNLTQKQFAEKLHVNVCTVRCWESEYHRILRPTYEKLFIQKVLE